MTDLKTPSKHIKPRMYSSVRKHVQKVIGYSDYTLYKKLYEFWNNYIENCDFDIDMIVNFWKSAKIRVNKLEKQHNRTEIQNDLITIFSAIENILTELKKSCLDKKTVLQSPVSNADKKSLIEAMLLKRTSSKPLQVFKTTRTPRQPILNVQDTATAPRQTIFSVQDTATAPQQLSKETKKALINALLQHKRPSASVPKPASSTGKHTSKPAASPFLTDLASKFHTPAASPLSTPKPDTTSLLAELMAATNKKSTSTQKRKVSASPKNQNNNVITNTDAATLLEGIKNVRLRSTPKPATPKPTQKPATLLTGIAALAQERARRIKATEEEGGKTFIQKFEQDIAKRKDVVPTRKTTDEVTMKDLIANVMQNRRKKMGSSADTKASGSDWD